MHNLLFLRMPVNKVHEELFAPEYKYLETTILNPIFGRLFIDSSFLIHFRLYSDQLDHINFIRNYGIDKSKDPLTNLVILLFPSPAGTLIHSSNKLQNFTKVYFSKDDD